MKVFSIPVDLIDSKRLKFLDRYETKILVYLLRKYKLGDWIKVEWREFRKIFNFTQDRINNGLVSLAGKGYIDSLYKDEEGYITGRMTWPSQRVTLSEQQLLKELKYDK